MVVARTTGCLFGFPAIRCTGGRNNYTTRDLFSQGSHRSTSPPAINLANDCTLDSQAPNPQLHLVQANLTEAAAVAAAAARAPGWLPCGGGGGRNRTLPTLPLSTRWSVDSVAVEALIGGRHYWADLAILKRVLRLCQRLH